MPLIAKDKPGVDYDPIPEGAYTALCYSVIDLGTQENKTFGGTKREVLIQWELPECRGEFERDGKTRNLPRAISQRFRLSLNEKSNLRKILQNWRGKAFTNEELEGFDIERVLGTPCQMQIVHNEGKDGKTYANIGTVMALPKNTAAPKTENPLTFFSFEGVTKGLPVLPDFPEWIEKIIKDSEEWFRLERGEDLSEASGPVVQEQKKPVEVYEDDLPF